jgi:hypothetical protein
MPDKTPEPAGQRLQRAKYPPRYDEKHEVRGISSTHIKFFNNLEAS